jgi:hypothetical protein
MIAIFDCHDGTHRPELRAHHRIGNPREVESAFDIPLMPRRAGVHVHFGDGLAFVHET